MRKMEFWSEVTVCLFGVQLVYPVILVGMWLLPSTKPSRASLNTEIFFFQGMLQNVSLVPLFRHFFTTLIVLNTFQCREASLEHKLWAKTPWMWSLAELKFLSFMIFDYFILLIYKMAISAYFTELPWRLNELIKAKI